jgi:glycosyltransferase involved in cell wall biosynthesis
MEDLPEITICVPTYNRSKFLPLFLMNVKSQSYPHTKLKLIIDDDGDEPFISDIDEVRRALHPIPVQYIKDKPRRSIGKKRNDIVKVADTKIVCFMDDDDVYMPTYIQHSYKIMKEGKFGCVGTDCMLFCMTDKNFDVHMIDCGRQARQLHEATMMMTKKWFRASGGFATKGYGEGKQMFDGGMDKLVGFTDIRAVMLCVQHSANSVEKLQFAKEENKIDVEIHEELINILKTILG